MEKELKDLLEKAAAGERTKGELTICHNGRSCRYREVFNYKNGALTTCHSAVPCNTATDHKFVIYKEF
jgi:hypothetical protein